MNAIPMSAVIMNVIPTPRSGRGMLEYSASRSRMAAIAVMARSQPRPHPPPAQTAVHMLGKSRCCMNSEPPSMAQFTAIRGRKMPSDE